MDGRDLKLLDLPAEVISDEICAWLTFDTLLTFRQTSLACKTLADTFIQNGLLTTSLLRVFNNEHNHYIYLCSIFKKNPLALKRLSEPETLLSLCEQLSPTGMLRMSIIFDVFKTLTYLPMSTIANGEGKNWFLAFLCCALFAPEIGWIDNQTLAQAIKWLEQSENKEKYTAIHTCLVVMHRAQDFIPFCHRDLPSKPCYLNLQHAHLPSIRLDYINLKFANLKGANITDGELLHTKLFGSYLKNTQTKGSYFLSTIFFDLANPTTSITQQLTMLDHQLTSDENATRLDESVTTDLLNQIVHRKITNEERVKCIELARNHPFFARDRLKNYDIRLAFIKAMEHAKHPIHSQFFVRPSLNPVFNSSKPVTSTTKRNPHQ